MSEKRMIHFKNEENGIEVSIPDGGMLRLFSENGDAQCVLCGYIDKTTQRLTVCCMTPKTLSDE